jgi:outer membrane receptor protein involved in Fe transport
MLYCRVMLVMAATLAGAAQAQEPAGPVTAYPPGFFAAAQPYSAFDMLARLPGFSFDPGDSEVRGFGGASGNVLIDGKRPTSKQESLEAVLRRIPARSVARIELVRPGAPGVDMQGRALVANVVRFREAETRGRIETGLGVYPHGRLGPRLAGELSRRGGDGLLELSAAHERQVDVEKGEGPRLRTAPTGEVLRAAVYREDKQADLNEAAAGYERGLAGGKLRLDASARRELTTAAILETASLPSVEEEQVSEHEDLIEGEVGAHYERALDGRWRTEGLVLHHRSRSRASDRAMELAEVTISRLDLDAAETVARGLVRREGATTTFEVGAEGAVNTLTSRSELTEDGQVIALPSARVRVEERRGEAFANLTWRPRPELTLEAGAHLERSTLTQSGDSRLQKTLTYPKPHALAIWSPDPRNEIRVGVERRVSQLDFEDFVSSASLTSNTVTAGNPDLEPDRTWRWTVSWERRLGEAGSVVLTVRQDAIQGVVDRVPVVGPDYAFDAPGNLGDGTRREVQAVASLPLDRAGMTGGLLQADLLLRRSRVTDPATHLQRPISDEPRFVGQLHLTQDLPGWRARWGVDLALAQTKVNYLFDEVKTDRVAARLAVFAEYRPTLAWNIRVHADNLTDGRVDRRREQYSGRRGTANLERVETRSMAFGRFIGVSIQHSFGV